MKQNMIGGRTAWGQRLAGGSQNQAAPAQETQGSTLAEMLGGNLYARQVGDNSLSPLAMLQQFRATGQLPTMPQSNVMFGQMPTQTGMPMMQVNPQALQRKGNK